MRAFDDGIPAGGYVPRRPETTPFHCSVRRHLETWLAQAGARERVVPDFVEREFRGFLDCGIAANGFLRLHCDGCGLDRVVPFSCKGRGFCPSCGGRHMADTAAHLVDLVLGRAATGPRSGQRMLGFGDRVEIPPGASAAQSTPGLVRAHGFSLHAGVAVPANDRQRLERFCRYAGRPPVATERLSEMADGRLLCQLRHRARLESKPRRHRARRELYWAVRWRLFVFVTSREWSRRSR